MSELKRQLQGYVESNIERVDVDDVRAIISHPTIGSPARRRLRPAWAFVLGAVAVLAVGAAAVLLRDTNTVLHDPASEGVATPDAPEAWNSILSTVEAGESPSAAICPEGSNPNTEGLMGQARPWGAQWSNQGAAFDARMGKIVFLDESGATWTFDVCTNSWEQANPSFDPPSFTKLGQQGWSGQLVYDVDSDRTIAFRGDSLAVYDSTTNTWTFRVQPSEYDTGIPGAGAVYHPDTGLVVVQTGDSGLMAYDVDTDIWTPIGQVEWMEQVPPYLVGYLSEFERFVFLGGFDERGMLVDGPTGEISQLPALEGGVFAGFGRLDFATGGSTGHVVRSLDGNGGDICRLDPASLDWECVSMNTGPKGFGQGSGLLAASVYDPINERLVLIYGYGPGFNGERFYNVNDIWAVDLNTGEWTLLLERNGEMTYEEDED